MENTTNKGQNRREFIKASTLAGLTASFIMAGCAQEKHSGQGRTNFKVAPIDTVRVGFVGVGHQGSNHMKNLLRIEGVEIKAICDMEEDRVQKIQQWCIDAGKPKPDGYWGDANGYKKMCQRDDIDLVYTATPWELHVPVMVEAMKNGKHAATEVPAAITLDQCWEMVETAEATNKHAVMMENCCYDRMELMTLNMVRQGVLGELLHATCGYMHDLRWHKLSRDYYWHMWRLQHSIKRNGDLYPTHGLGPVAQCMNINRGNQFDYLISESTKTRGLNLYAAEKYGPDDPLAKQKYALGDIVTTMIRTVGGETINITHATNDPRPYSRDYMVQGTKGLVRKYPEQLAYYEGMSEGEKWQEFEKLREQFEHPLWKDMEEMSKGAGHGGMDFIEDFRLIQALRKGTPMDMDVYDAAAWSAVSPLSEQSIAQNGRPVKFPDFTRGKWKTNPPLGIVRLA